MYLFFKKENLFMRVLILLLSIASLSVFIFGNDESKVKNSSVDCINNNAITFDEYGNEKKIAIHIDSYYMNNTIHRH